MTTSITAFFQKKQKSETDLSSLSPIKHKRKTREGTYGTKRKRKDISIFGGEKKQRLMNGEKRKGKMFQAVIDVGKRPQVECKECGMVYSKGVVEDEKMHERFHRGKVGPVAYSAWSDECIVAEYMSGYVMVVDSETKQYKRRKFVELIERVNELLCLSEEEKQVQPGEKTYCYVSKGKIVACASAKPISKAYRIVDDSLKVNQPKENPEKADSENKDQNIQTEDSPKTILNVLKPIQKKKKQIQVDNISLSCSNTPIPAQVAITKIWVHNSFQRQGLATRLLNAIKNTFLDTELEKTALAFTQPTASGRALATHYFNTTEFLINLD